MKSTKFIVDKKFICEIEIKIPTVDQPNNNQKLSCYGFSSWVVCAETEFSGGHLVAKSIFENDDSCPDEEFIDGLIKYTFKTLNLD